MFLVLNPPYGPPEFGGPITLVCAVVYFPEEDHGSDEDGNASSEEGNGADEEDNGSAGVEGSCSDAEGSDAASADGAGSLEGSVGSDQAGRASTDSCACAARTSAKKIAATSTDILPAIRWAISAAVVAAERAEKGAER